MNKKALITGITGQDGSYLAELLLGKGYAVHGVVRRTSSLGRSRLKHLYEDSDTYGKRLFLHYADLDDTTTLRRILHKVQPGEIYHLAGQSHVGLSFEIPESTCEMTAMATLRLLEIVRDLPSATRFYHASSSEVFGNPSQVPQDEETPFDPVSPYGCAKAFATQMVRIYRKSFGVFACNGINYNHESPRRGENFVSRKICRAAAAMKMGIEKELVLGDLTPSGIGATPATTSEACGSPFSTIPRRTSCLRPACSTACRTSSSRLFMRSGSTGKLISGRTSASCAVLNPIGCWETRPRRGSFSNGNPKPPSSL